MSKPTKKDVESIRGTITHSGEFRVHLIYARSGLCAEARMWHHDGHTVGIAHGSGYDKGGSALGQAIELLFAEELKALKPGYEYNKMEGGPLKGQTLGQKVKDGLYGLTRHADGTMSLDGACGKGQMLKVLVALGFTDCNLYETGKLSSMVVARKPARG